MSEFNITSWMKKQYLAEAKLDTPKSSQLASAINSAIEGIDSEMNYRDFAVAVANILENGYGSHLYDKFMEVLHAELGMNESINENEDLSSLDDFLKYFKSYDAYYEYIDDGGQYRMAKDNNDRILSRFNALSPEDREVALKAVQDHFKDERAIKAFK